MVVENHEECQCQEDENDTYGYWKSSLRGKLILDEHQEYIVLGYVNTLNFLESKDEKKS